jgi:hypothetical protein
MTMTDYLPSPLPTLPGWLQAACRQLAADIAVEDWDLMFRATLDVLAQVAVEKPASGDPDLRLQAPGATLCECMDALDHLRRSVPAMDAQGAAGANHLEDSVASVTTASVGAPAT